VDPALLPPVIGIKGGLVVKPDYEMVARSLSACFKIFQGDVVLLPFSHTRLVMTPGRKENILAIINNVITFVTI